MLLECLEHDVPLPVRVRNKGPLISAKRSIWEKTAGFDEHDVWSTGLSRTGQDLVCRMELITQTPSFALSDQFSVHPWHPEGFSRSTSQSTVILESHLLLSRWAIINNEPDWKNRLVQDENILRRYNNYYRNHWAKDKSDGLSLMLEWMQSHRMKVSRKLHDSFKGRPVINGL